MNTVVFEIIDQFYRTCTKDKFLHWLAANSKLLLNKERQQIEEANQAEKEENYYSNKFTNKL